MIDPFRTKHKGIVMIEEYMKAFATVLNGANSSPIPSVVSFIGRNGVAY